MENKKPIIYTSSTCPYCDMAKDYFKSKGIEFEEKNTSEPENRQKLVAMGIRGVPAIFIGDQHFVGFDANEIDRLLAENGAAPQAEAPQANEQPKMEEEAPKFEEEPKMDEPAMEPANNDVVAQGNDMNRADYEPVPEEAKPENLQNPAEEAEQFDNSHPQEDFQDEAIEKGIPEGNAANMKKYVCTVCGYVYDPAIGDDVAGIAPGTSFDDLPEDWVCPLCGVDKSQFEEE